jgi:hypothetical protein
MTLYNRNELLASARAATATLSENGLIVDKLDYPPHIEWIKTTRSRIIEKGKQHPDLAATAEVLLLDRMTSDEYMKFFSHVQNKDVMGMVFNYDLMRSVQEAQEILIKKPYKDLYNKAGLEIKGIINKESFKDFKLPFPEMVFTFMDKDKKYLPMFIQLFEISEKIRNPETGEEETAYCFKEMHKKKTYDNITTIQHDYVSISEGLFVLSKIPRVFIPKFINQQCGSCNMSTDIHYIENNIVSVIPTTHKRESRHCMKTPMTISVCNGLAVPHLCGDLDFNADKYSERIIKVLGAVKQIVDVLNKSPKRIEKIAESIRMNRGEVKFSTGDEDRHYIEIVDKKYVYPFEKKVSKGGTHASPIPHPRRGFERRYKSGKVSPVRPTMVNKDKEIQKPVYVIK